MTATTTTRLGLYKTSSDGADFVNVVTDLLNNLDAIDLNIGYRDCTSTTRPSTVWKGLPIRESDTGRLYVSNGTAPASASWKQIPAEGASFLAAFTFAGALTLSSTLAVSGATTLASTLGVTGAVSLNSTLAVTGAVTASSTMRATGMASAYAQSTVTVGTSSTSYVDTSTVLSTTIVVPPSGKVDITGTITHYSNSGGYSYSDLLITGSTSGTLRTPTDVQAMRLSGPGPDITSSYSFIQTAAAGETLTMKWQHRVTTGANQMVFRAIKAIPLLG
ncbi:hypothetical protein [Kitasatospora sp. NPDC057223]|uniref:hypothetical protein n=1 Tax=Kitasatospora sp. NPDC057223 TaxID=3346055 RepID=UPI003637B418